jgi:hypothetical protein
VPKFAQIGAKLRNFQRYCVEIFCAAYTYTDGARNVDGTAVGTASLSLGRFVLNWRLQVRVIDYTLVTLPRFVTPYRDSVYGTRDRVTYQKLVTRKGGYTLVTLPRIVTPYRDSVDRTRDRVTYQKLVTRKGDYTLVTLPRIVTPYRDSVDETRDRVTYQKLVTR